MSTIYKKYSSIPNFYKCRRVYELPQVVVTEKVDGTNFSFGTLPDKHVMNSRNHMMWKYSKRDNTEAHVPTYDGFGAVARFKEFFPDAFNTLEEYGRNLIVFGEFFGKGIQKRINYCGDEKKFVFFDMFDVDEDKWVGHFEFEEICFNLKIPTAPVLWSGPPNKDKFEELMTMKSVIASRHGIDDISEGIIIKGLFGDVDEHGERVIVKYKSEEFAEVSLEMHDLAAMRRKKGEMGGRDYGDLLAKKYVTESRLENCLEKFRGESKEMTIKIISEVITYMADDAMKDLIEEDKNNELFDEKLIRKAFGNNSAILFKQWLKNNGN